VPTYAPLNGFRAQVHDVIRSVIEQSKPTRSARRVVQESEQADRHPRYFSSSAKSDSSRQNSDRSIVQSSLAEKREPQKSARGERALENKINSLVDNRRIPRGDGAENNLCCDRLAKTFGCTNANITTRMFSSFLFSFFSPSFYRRFHPRCIGALLLNA